MKTNQNVIPKLFVSLSSEVRTQTPWKLKKPNKSTSVVQCLNKRKTKPRKLINTLVYYHQKTVWVKYSSYPWLLGRVLDYSNQKHCSSVPNSIPYDMSWIMLEKALSVEATIASREDPASWKTQWIIWNVLSTVAVEALVCYVCFEPNTYWVDLAIGLFKQLTDFLIGLVGGVLTISSF